MTLIDLSNEHPMLDPVYLQTFLTVSECKSFSKASRRLQISQPTVSDHIRKLEASLGHRLFLRDTHSVNLTQEGDELREFARDIIETNLRAKNHFSNAKLRKRIRLGASEDLVWSWLPAILSEFIQSHAEVDLELTFHLSSTLIEKFDAGDLDLVLCKRSPGVERGELLWRDDLIWAGAHPEPVISNDKLQLILYPPPSVTRFIALAALARAQVPWRIVCTSGNLTGLVAAAKIGLGVICFARQCLPDGLVACHASEMLPPLGETEFTLLRSRGSRNDALADYLANAIMAKAGTLAPISATTDLKS